MLCSESFIERTDTPMVPHGILMARRDDYKEKSDAACELRQESIDNVQKYLQFHRDFFGAFQCLQDALNEMVSCVGIALWTLHYETWGFARDAQPETLQDCTCGVVLSCIHNESCVAYCLPLHEPKVCDHHTRIITCAASNQGYFSIMVQDVGRYFEVIGFLADGECEHAQCADAAGGGEFRPCDSEEAECKARE